MTGNEAVSMGLLVVVEIVALALLALFYFTPTIVAFKRRHANRWVIFALNFFFGATGIVWLGCLIWACKAVHLSTEPQGSNGGESGLNLTANDIKPVRLEPLSSAMQSTAENKGDDILDRLEKLKRLFDDGVIDATQFQNLRDRIVQN